MPQSGRRSRSTSLSGPARPRQTAEFAALILAQGNQNGNLDSVSQESKALFPLANKPMLYYSIKQLESVGFDKKEIYVAISGDDLKEYEADERVVPIESRLPDANFIRVRQVESSMDTLRKAVREIDNRDGLPENLLVVYVDVVCCEVLTKVAEISRVYDPALVSVYGPRSTGMNIKDLPGAESTHSLDKVTKLIFFNGEDENENVRKVFLTIDTENYDDESIRLSNRVLAKAGGHIEASSDLDDQGIFLFRKDMVQWIVHSPDDKHWMSIRDDLIPELMKCQYKPFSDDFPFTKVPEFLAVIDESGTTRLDSVEHLVYTSRKIIAKELHQQWVVNSRPELKNCDVDESSIFGDNCIRFNDAETERMLKDDASDTVSSDTLEGCTKLLVRKSVIGPRCRIEYEASDDKKKTTTISNSVVMGDVRISVGCKLNNCIVGSGATIGDQCTLANCLIGPGVIVEKGKNLRNQTLEVE